MKTKPQQTDIVTEARAKLAKPNYGTGKRNRELMTKLCDEVERLRPVVDAAVEWRRVGYERKDELAYRIGPLLDAIDIYDVGHKRPCEDL